MRIVAISDTHGMHRRFDVPDGDVLIHAGDLTGHGELAEVEEFDTFLGTLPHRHKIVIAGNHDFCFERRPGEAGKRLTNATYLQDEMTTVDGIVFYGSPWQPWFHDWAFNLQRGPEIKAKWDLIPEGVDVLITHGPPWGYGDRTLSGLQVGCEDLLAAVQRVMPRLHIFGHIHEGHGIIPGPDTTFVNASACTAYFEPRNAPLVFDL